MGRVSAFALVLALLISTTEHFPCMINAQLPTCLESDREALVDFKQGLIDPENRLSSWRGKHCCQWWGISCKQSTRAVVAVNLRNPHPLIRSDSSSDKYGLWNLSGEIRPSLMKLKSLKYLDLSFNTFKDIPIPKFLGSLKNLQYLNLSSAGFSGIIPPTLGNLSNLQYFDVSGFLSVHNLEWLTALGSLKHLGMNYVYLSRVQSSLFGILNKLPDLTELHLMSCQLSGPLPHLSSVNFTSLAVIDISFNSMRSKLPDWLANISSLVYLDLSENYLFGRIPPGLSELPNLQVLNFAHNLNLVANCSELLAGSWRKIEVLDLAYNNLYGEVPSSIGNMTFLIGFDLSVNIVEGRIPSSIGNLGNLKNLDVSGNRFQGVIPSSIGKLCNLQNLLASDNNLTGTLPEFLEGTGNCYRKNPFPYLVSLNLKNNQFIGQLPRWLGQLKNLESLVLSKNSLQGPIQTSLGTLHRLAILNLGYNELNGTLPEGIGQLSELTALDVSSNRLTGIVTEAHFSKLSKLKMLLLSSNSLILNVSSNWTPPFRLDYLFMDSCRLGPSFPGWLETQTELRFLSLSNASISGSIPSWFQDISAKLLQLNISHNQIWGKLPNPLKVPSISIIDFSSNLFDGPISLPVDGTQLLDLSNNQLSGTIPAEVGETMPSLSFLSLSGNQIKGEIPISIEQMMHLQIIDLSRNSITGSIPSNIGKCLELMVLDFGKNNLSGAIPGSLGQLKMLQALHLNDNMLSGELPTTFSNLLSLETLDLANNRVTGNIPPWIGHGFPVLRILSLRSNAFFGELPNELSRLSSLQILDLAENDLIGSIPASFGELKAIIQEQKINKNLIYGLGNYYKESLVVRIKGQLLEYNTTLSLVTCIDLSGNNLSGEFPKEITKLFGLLVLNLSRNQISGHIAASISQLHELTSLDLSINMLSGTIPPSMPSLTFLSYLNLSNNNLSGPIPYTGQMTTFTASSFDENPGLCGVPLTSNCQGDDPVRVNVGEDRDTDLVDNWFYLIVGLGFATGVLIPYFILALKKSWADAYFGYADKIILRLPWVRNRNAIQRRNHWQH